MTAHPESDRSAEGFSPEAQHGDTSALPGSAGHVQRPYPDRRAPPYRALPAKDNEDVECGASGDASELIPLSMLNAFAYCPRRFHYEFVQGVMQDNVHVVQGRRRHTRIDDPSLAERPRRENDAIHTRSVWLSSELLGVTGKIDILEERDDRNVPVEYKSGNPPPSHRAPEGYWPNDAVQLCAQALLLEEVEGRRVDEGILYFARTRRRVTVPITETLRRLTRQTIADAAALAKQDEIPPPLIDSPKCPACSLVTLCMPDETNRLRSLSRDARREEGGCTKDPEEAIRCLIPRDYDTEILYVTEQGASITKSGDCFVVKSRDGAKLAEVPSNRLRQICIYGYGQLTTQAVHACMGLGINVAYLSTGGRLKGCLAPLPNPNGLLRWAVADALRHEPVRLAVAREIVAAKIDNQRVMLMRNTEDRDEGSGLSSDIDELNRLSSLAYETVDRGGLLGVEGAAAKIYFSRFADMIKPAMRSLFSFQNRNRKPPRDPVNALLSLAYACLCKDVLSAIASVGLDPYLGALHQPRHGQPALALDLMEEFRPIIADSVVLTLINNRMLTESDFLRGRQSCNLTDRGRRTFFEAYERRKSNECTHPIFGYRTSYVRLIEMQARLLACFLTGQVTRYCGFRTR